MRGFAIFCLLLHLVVNFYLPNRVLASSINHGSDNSGFELPHLTMPANVTEIKYKDTLENKNAGQIIEPINDVTDIDKQILSVTEVNNNTSEEGGSGSLVNHFTGDLNYSIPLFEIDGYPMKLSYTSGATMEQEASWVGLGWNLAPGAINRSIRGLPDDFKGDKIVHSRYMKPNRTITLSTNVPFLTREFFGLPIEFSANVAYTYNNYTGLYSTVGLGAGYQRKTNLGESNTSLNLSLSERDGLSLSPSFSMQRKVEGINRVGYAGGSLSMSLNSRGGLSSLTPKAFFGGATTKDFENEKYTSRYQNGYGGSISFSDAYQSPPDINMDNLTLLGNSKFGSYKVGDAPHSYNLAVTYSQNLISDEDKNKVRPGYGYLNLDSVYSGSNGSKTNIQDEAILDFAKEKDQGLSNYVPNMAMPFLTFDSYNLSTQQYSSTFRAYKPNISVVFDPKSNSGPKVPVNVSPELNLGSLAKVAFSGNFGYSETYTGPSRSKSDRNIFINEVVGYVGNAPSLNNPVTFKDEGGFSTIDHRNYIYYNFYGKMNPTAINISKSSDDSYVLTERSTTPDDKLPKVTLTTLNSVVSDEVLPVVETPAKRLDLFKFDEFGSSISSFNKGDCFQIVDWVKAINFYVPNESKTGQYRVLSTLSRDVANTDLSDLWISTEIPNHHIWAFESKNSNGMIFRFGMPQITWYTKEFSATVEPNPSTDYGNAHYVNNSQEFPFPKSTVQAAASNSGGQNKSFNYKKTPAFIDSYLITSVLSPDYVDRSGNGPSDDDAGTFVKFNYLLKYKNFGVRTPNSIKIGKNEGEQPVTSESHRFNLSPNVYNNFGTNSDDIASFTYLEKEVWDLKEMVGRSSIATFEVEDDVNRFGVDINGTKTNKFASRLKKVKIFDRYYSKQLDRFVQSENPKLTIEFIYETTSNSLMRCRSTLKELVFMEYQSSKGSSRRYRFEYGQFFTNNNQIINLKADYNKFNQDRWGAPVSIEATSTDISNLSGLKASPAPDFLPHEFPFVSNSIVDLSNGGTASIHNSVDVKANVWNLTQITTPTNTKIQIQYERDSYSYVENEKAGEMYKILGFYESLSTNSSNTEDYTLSEDLIHLNENKKLFIKLELPLPSNILPIDQPKINQFKRNLVTKADGSVMDKIYFKAWVQLRRGFKPEWITGYAELEDPLNSVISIPDIEIDSDNKLYAYIRVKPESLFRNSDTKINPIAKASYNRMKSELRFIFNNHIMSPEVSVEDLATSLVRNYKEILNTTLGFNTMCKTQQLANVLATDKSSLIRLGSLTNVKFGGNQRVKYVKYINNVDIYGGSSSERSGITVFYKYFEGNQLGTSGVASSEPLLGQEDNLRKYPISYEKELVLAPDLSYSQEGPYGESLQQPSTIGYSYVQVTEQSSLGTVGDSKYVLGKEVYTFITAKDYPTKLNMTPLIKQNRSFSLPLIFYMYKLKSFGASQGFTYEANNMHGKPKSKRIYGGFSSSSGASSPISGVDYFYKLKNGNVYNNVAYVDKSLKISNSTPDFTSSEFDWVVYNREESSVSNVVELNMNLEIFFAGPVLLPLPIPIIYVARSEDKFKYIAFTKQRSVYGMLDSTVTFDLSNYVVSKVEAYDKHTGEPVVSSVTNSFKDKQYAVNIPAYWVYSSLGKSNIDAGKVFVDVYDKNIPNGSTLKLAGNSSFPTILKSGNKFSFLQGDGRSTSIRAARAVQAMIDDPTANGSIEEFLKNRRVLSISSGNKNMLTVPAQTANFIRNPLTDNNGKLLERLNLSGSVLDAKAFVFDKYQCENVDGINKMAYLESYFKPTASYYYKSDRVQSRINQNVNLRTDGVYTSFTPFWNLTGNKIVKNRSNWVLVDTILTIDEFGFPLETVDKTGRIITRIPGNSASVLRLEAFNANTNDLFFEDFEMNSKNDENALDFKANGEKDKIKDVLSHSGNKAYEVGRNSNFRLYVPLVPDECKEYDCETAGGGGGGDFFDCCPCPTPGILSLKENIECATLTIQPCNNTTFELILSKLKLTNSAISFNKTSFKFLINGNDCLTQPERDQIINVFKDFGCQNCVLGSGIDDDVNIEK